MAERKEHPFIKRLDGVRVALDRASDLLNDVRDAINPLELDDDGVEIVAGVSVPYRLAETMFRADRAQYCVVDALGAIDEIINTLCDYDCGDSELVLTRLDRNVREYDELVDELRASLTDCDGGEIDFIADAEFDRLDVPDSEEPEADE